MKVSHSIKQLGPESGKSELEKVVFLVQIEFFSIWNRKIQQWQPMFFYLENSSWTRKTPFLVQIYRTLVCSILNFASKEGQNFISLFWATLGKVMK